MRRGAYLGPHRRCAERAGRTAPRIPRTAPGGSFVAAVDAAGAVTAWNPGAFARVHALASDGRSLYAGGPLTALHASGLARFQR